MTAAASAGSRGKSVSAACEPSGHAGGRLRAARSTKALVLLAVLMAAGIAGFCALGVWQLERRVWKLDLIARVDTRIHAAPVAAPGPAAWSAINGAEDEYRRVRVFGTFLNDRETLVQAVTEAGPGYWVMTPLRTDAGFTVLVNRGFVPADRRDPASRTAGEITGEAGVTGLLRMTEPKGGFLRSNDPAEGRWYSRDVAAIAAADGLTGVAPYFIDADGAPNPGGFPLGGLTVVSFRNSHLVYALTWFGLALTLLVAASYVIREELRLRSRTYGAGR